MLLDIVRGKLASNEVKLRPLARDMGYSHSYIKSLVDGKSPLPRDIDKALALVEAFCRVLELPMESLPEYQDLVARREFRDRPDLRDYIFKIVMDERRQKRKGSA